MSQIHQEHCGNYTVPNNLQNCNCIDIGGNTGMFSLKYKDFFKKIHVYEPQKECYNIIKNKIKDVLNIELFPEAVYNKSGATLKLISHNNHDSGSVALDTDVIVQKEWKKDCEVNKCETISLEDVLKRMGGKIDYMKIDCETGEYNFLMDKDLSNIKYLAVEIHWQIGRNNWYKLINHILKFFKNITPVTNPTGYNLKYPVGWNKELLFESKNL